MMMIKALVPTLRGSFTLTLMTLNVILWFMPIMAMSVFKFTLPFQGLRLALTRWMTRCAEFWIYCNKAIFKAMLNVRWEFRGLTHFTRKDWYLVISNHRSWIDILALQQAFIGKIPFLKFFIKQSLIWVPFLGPAWWALDMPFMKRYTREEIARNPELKGKDLETTRKACAHFSHTPTTVFNFVEGTRFTEEKHRRTQSPYRHLLLPRAGGIAFTMGSMQGILRRLLDVNLIYPDGTGSLWDFCSGRVRRIIVDIRELPLESWMGAGNYSEDENYRLRFQQWLSELWNDKDARIDAILREARTEAATAG